MPSREKLGPRKTDPLRSLQTQKRNFKAKAELLKIVAGIGGTRLKMLVVFTKTNNLRKLNAPGLRKILKIRITATREHLRKLLDSKLIQKKGINKKTYYELNLKHSALQKGTFLQTLLENLVGQIEIDLESRKERTR